MGMFDSIYLDITCPNCGDKARNEAQTKDLENELEVWEVGDWVTDELHELECIAACENCWVIFKIDVLLDKRGCVSGEYRTDHKFKIFEL